MSIDEHIKNLEEYCEDDDLFKKDGDFKDFCDGHISDIKAVLEELRNTQSDLYEANNRITDLLLILGDRDRMINKMSEQLTTPIHDKEWVIKYFEKESKNAKD